MKAGGVVVVILGALLLWLIYDTYWRGEVEYMTSSVDERTYLVRSLPDKQAAANLLAQIRGRLEAFIGYLKTTVGNDKRVQKVVERIQLDQISEGSEDSQYTSYSVNKGERIVFCLRHRDGKKTLMDINTMMFVALHEVAHVGTESVGHTPEFWDNFRWFLEQGIASGVYERQDFQNKPVEYCGLQIQNSPLDKKTQ